MAHEALRWTDAVDDSPQLTGPVKIAVDESSASELIGTISQDESTAPIATQPQDRKSTRLNSSHSQQSRMPSSA